MTSQPQPNPAWTYQEYLAPALFIPWSKVLLEHARPEPGERVLDLACGTGIVARQAAPLVGSQGAVVGLDVSPGMLAVARELPAPKGASIDWREASAVEMPVLGAAFDIVLCQQGLQFFPNRLAAMKEALRALDSGGRLVLSVWQGLHRHDVYRAIFEAEARFLEEPIDAVARPFSFGDAEDLRALLVNAGFQKVKVFSETRDVRFSEPDRFVELTAMAGAAVIPELAQEDPRRLIEAVRAESHDILERHREGEWLRFPMTAHFAIACKG